MLMALPPPDTEVRRSSLPGHIQLPSFRHFVSGAEQGKFTLPPVSWGTFPYSHPSSDSRTLAPLPHDTHREPRLDSQPAIAGSHSHYVGVQPKAAVQQPRPTELYREYQDTPSIATNNSRPPPQDTFSGSSLHPSQPPVVIHEANVDGKGQCYVYDNGSVVQKIINGDTVNPKWGTTKAGKPRKRLGQACNTCREKKIRCDPHIPKCAQCQKFGRECKFESSARSSKGFFQQPPSKESPSARETRGEVHHKRTGSSTSAEALTDRSYSRANSRGSMNVENLLSPSSTVDASPSSEQPPSKRPRLSSPPNHDGQMLRGPSVERPHDAPAKSIKSQTEASFAYDTDPVLVDSRLVMHFSKEYFKHVNAHINFLYPSRMFLHWVEHCATKSLEDKMLLYAILAAGLAFSQAKYKETYQYQFKNIADVALDRNSSNGLQAVQTQMILAMVEYSKGHLDKSRELSLAAYQMACCAGLNEETAMDDAKLGLDLDTRLECRRRTFWLSFAAVCFHDNKLGPNLPVQSLKCNLRLPCENEVFESGEISETPLFSCSPGEKWEFPSSSKLGNLAFLVEISLIASEVTQWLNNTSDELEQSEYARSYETFSQTTLRKLSTWNKRVREHYQVKELDTTGLHILYHLLGMLLHRHGRHDFLTSEQVERNCRETRHHAAKLLEMIHLLHEGGGKDMPMAAAMVAYPISGHSIFMAIGIITAAGTISSLLEHQSRAVSVFELVCAGLEALDALSQHWQTAENQLKEVKARISTVMNPTTSGTSSRKVAFSVRTPFSSPYGLHRDVIYGIPRIRYLRALGYGNMVKSEDDICEMGLLGSQ